MQSLRRASQTLNTLRRYATAQAQAGKTAAESAGATDAATKPRRYKRKNLAEVAAYLPENGLGAKFTRLLWIRNGYEGSYWTITKIRETEAGKTRFYGRLTWRGVDTGRERRVNTQNKRGWRFIREE